jgi:hypothetical protein
MKRPELDAAAPHWLTRLVAQKETPHATARGTGGYCWRPGFLQRRNLPIRPSQAAKAQIMREMERLVFDEMRNFLIANERDGPVCRFVASRSPFSDLSAPRPLPHSLPISRGMLGAKEELGQ